jgi:hypothetical protein
MSPRYLLTQTALLSVVTLPLACADDPSKPSDQLKIYESCLQTVCDQVTQSGNDACSACTSACFAASYDCDPSTACSDSCASRDCSDSDKTTCLQPGYKVTFPNDPSQLVGDACNRAVSQFASCGYTGLSTSDCTRYAAVDIPSDAAAFDCIANLDCGSFTADTVGQCIASVPSTTFGDAFCAQLASACPSNPCSSGDQSGLDADGAWLRQDALDAVSTCLQQSSCDETSQCLSAWRSAVE